MKYGRLPSDSIFIDHGLAIHVGTAIQQQPDSIQIFKLCGYVQKGRSTQREQSCGGRPEIECGKLAMDQRLILIQQFREVVQPVANHCHHSWNLVF
jgi:hypothetical protein